LLLYFELKYAKKSCAVEPQQVKQQELNSESEHNSMLYRSVFKFLEFAVHYFMYVGQLGLGIVRKTYNDDDNNILIHLFTVLTVAICRVSIVTVDRI
jgi:hypothetical protein